MRSIEHGKIIQYLFRPDFLNNSDQRIGNDHRKKCQIPERPHQAEQNCQYKKDQVEIREDILLYNLLCSLGC